MKILHFSENPLFSLDFAGSYDFGAKVPIFENPDWPLVRVWSSQVVNSKKYLFFLYQKLSNTLCGHVLMLLCIHTLRIVAVQSVSSMWKSFTFQKIHYFPWISRNVHIFEQKCLFSKILIGIWSECGLHRSLPRKNISFFSIRSCLIHFADMF